MFHMDWMKRMFIEQPSPSSHAHILENHEFHVEI